jgi:tellurite resistance protein
MDDTNKNSGEEQNPVAIDPNSVPGGESAAFINEQVLNQTVTPMTGSAKPLADQAAAMMIQDMRSFLQGTEQMMFMAISKAAAQVLKTDGLEGKNALNIFKEVLKDLPEFAEKIGGAAALISKEFK